MPEATEPASLALVLSENGRFRTELPLGRERLRIGRRPYNDLVLDDLTVSGEHALILIHPEACLIRDLDSRNGTHVNGRPVAECRLAEGDCIDIGIYRLRLARAGEAAEGMAEGAEGAAPQVAVPGQAPVQDMAPAAGQSAALAEPRGQVAVAEPLSDMPVLEYLGGPYAGITQRIDRNILRIGNGDSQAAVLARRRSGWFVTHLEGMAVPVVNGVAIGLVASPLADGDLIELAGARIRFRLRG